MKNNIHDHVGIVGQGYVGLPLALAAISAKMNVIGVDVDLKKVKMLNSGISPVDGITNQEIQSALENKKYIASSNYEDLLNCNIIIICVPTPLDEDKKPDLSILLSATKSVGLKLRPGALVIIESTVETGTTRNIAHPTLIEFSKLNDGDFHLAFSPERIDPMNKLWNIKNTPKLVAGLNPQSLKLATTFYSKFIDNVVECQTLEIAETAKLLENSFRLINISFINEISIYCQKIGVDIKSVINAASTKPYGFMPFHPGIGIGGHCIPVDPVYLSEAARKAESPISMIELATQINLNLANHFTELAKNILGSLKDKKIIVIGVAYKANVADVRETPVEGLINRLRESGSVVVWHDEVVKTWNGEDSMDLSENYDLAIVATQHQGMELSRLGKTPILNADGSI